MNRTRKVGVCSPSLVLLRHWGLTGKKRFDLKLCCNNPNPKIEVNRFELLLNPNHYFQGFTLITIVSD